MQSKLTHIPETTPLSLERGSMHTEELLELLQQNNLSLEDAVAQSIELSHNPNFINRIDHVAQAYSKNPHLPPLQELLMNAMLPDHERIEAIENQLDITFTDTQKTAVLQAHHIG